MHTRLKGLVRCQTVSDGKVMRDTGFFSNLLTDAFFSASLAGNGITNFYCTTGAGANPPAVSDTTLQSPVSGWRVQTSFTESRTYDTLSKVLRFERVTTFTHNLGEVVGNISELGFHIVGNAPYLTHSRVLVKDPLGDPTTIPVQVTEQFVVTYVLIAEMLVPDAGVVSTVDINGVETQVSATITNESNLTLSNLLKGWLNLTQFGWVRALETNVVPLPFMPLATASGFNAINVTRNKPDIFTLRQSLYIPIDSGNFPSGLGTLGFSYVTGIQYLLCFNPKVNKVPTKIFDITLTQTLGRV